MNSFAIVGALYGALAVVSGAFGAHALEARLDAEALAIWRTAARYQMYHALALIIAADLAADGTAATIAGWSWIGGIVVFSGSLYLLAWTDIDWLGAITPIGGAALVVGWVALAAALWS